ncbi:hypothetical protein PAMC26510_06505 [Caballeronia sordidicola]|jgi:hypothetical protein|uniref:Uncharacterized protein n=1 Tax=Caballeronia sordidicola TaxID=196367 RepID=A0A242N606_CABSO|nr:hypothetical protein PAMC26510_06505 [Caballeronia sordidicola]
MGGKGTFRRGVRYPMRNQFPDRESLRLLLRMAGPTRGSNGPAAEFTAWVIAARVGAIPPSDVPAKRLNERTAIVP